jgi:hypothetical protein
MTVQSLACQTYELPKFEYLIANIYSNIIFCPKFSNSGLPTVVQTLFFLPKVQSWFADSCCTCRYWFFKVLSCLIIFKIDVLTMTSEYEILLFNAFVVWVNAGVFTQIILTRKQQERDEHMLKICSSMKNPDYNLNKKLTIRRIEHWDVNVFIPIAMDLFSSMPGYMKEAMKECEDPFQMHGQLILGASLLLYQCVMVGGMCSRTMEAIESWFCFLGHLEDSKLFRSLELDHQDEIQNIARKYIDVSNNKKGTTKKTKQFPHFSPRALFISHAHLVHMMFFKKSHAKYEKWSMLSGLSLSTLLGIKPNVDGITAPFPYLGSTSLSISNSCQRNFYMCP